MDSNTRTPAGLPREVTPVAPQTSNSNKQTPCRLLRPFHSLAERKQATDDQVKKNWAGENLIELSPEMRRKPLSQGNRDLTIRCRDLQVFLGR